MHNWKSILSVLAALILVILGGFLPRLSSRAMDRLEGHSVSFGDMAPIRLEVADKDQWKSLPSVEKLSLLRNRGQRYNVTEGIMHSDAEEIWASFREIITDYWKQGLFPTMEDCTGKMLNPCLIFDQEGSEMCDLFWQVQVNLSSGEDELTLFCLMDDETRHIYSLYYATYNGTALLTSGTLEDLASAYFRGLELEPELVDQGREHLVYMVTKEMGYPREIYVGFHQIRDAYRSVIQMDIQ